MAALRTKKAFLEWLQEPNEVLKQDYLLSTHYNVGSGMLHLKNLDVKNHDLTEKNFFSTEFKNCHFENCNFTSAIISSCTLVDCIFIDCSFTWTKFFETDLLNVTISNCTIHGVEVADLVCKPLHFENCNDISDLTLHGSFADRQIFFSNCYIGYLNVEPITEKYSEVFQFSDCILQKSSFNGINLSKSKFVKCNLSSNRFSNCIFTYDTFEAQNETPGKEFNLLDLQTILNSDVQSPSVLENIFGINNSDIKDYIHGLTTKIEFQSVFISYSFNNKEFAKRINNELISKGILTTLWEKDSPGGRPLEEIMSMGVNEKDRVLFIASIDSLKSIACHFELSEGRRKQEKTWEDVLFPIHIDDYLFKIRKENIRPIKVQDEYWDNILELRKLNSLDFSPFNDNPKFDKKAFDNQIYRLLKGLRRVK
jgi:uncharacterized protein YjbI with pentapeptide repeats